MKIPLFDIDGTLFKSGDLTHKSSMDYALKLVYDQLPREREFITHGMTDREIFVEFLKSRGVNPEITREKVESAMQLMIKYFNERRENINPELLPGVKSILTEIKKRNIPIGLLTGNVEGVAWIRIETAGLKDFFSFGAFGDKTEIRSELVEIARQNAGIALDRVVSKNELVIVGDTPRDVQCGRDSGIQVIAVATGAYDMRLLEEEKPDLLVDNLEVGLGEVLRFLNN